MPSSISHFEAHKADARGVREGALPAGLRQTAANRPGQAQPVPTRDIPLRPWVRMGAFVFFAVALLLTGWEYEMRRIGLRAGDIDDSPQAWAEARRAADLAPVAIVGDSRILFDTDQDRFQALTGVRPVQISVVGTTARALLEDVANDPKFKGLLIVGLAEVSYFRAQGVGFGASYMHAYDRNDKPSQLSGLWIERWLQNYLAFMDSEYRLSRMANELDRGIRKGVDSPYEDVWKISETFPGRQYFMWHRIETDPSLRAHARHAWNEPTFMGPPIQPATAAKVIARSAEAVRRIRARGGDVIFVRPPSAPELRIHEDKRLPRARGWDELLAGTNAKGIHFDDLPQAQNLIIPEWSHLSRKCATVFTDAYVRRLAQLTPRLKLRPDAPRPLTRADCVTQTVAMAGKAA